MPLARIVSMLDAGGFARSGAGGAKLRGSGLAGWRAFRGRGCSRVVFCALGVVLVGVFRWSWWIELLRREEY